MKKNSAKKARIKKHIIKKGWVVLGLVLFLWTVFWFIEGRIINKSPSVVNMILLTTGYTLLINYLLATSIYWTVKRLKKKWEIRV